MKRIATLLVCLTFATASFACSSVIISGKYTANGKPLMLKVRDQSEKKQNTNVQYFEGEKYTYLGLVGNAAQKHEKIRSIVGGVNSEGLCTMSLTSHSFEANEKTYESVKKPSIQMEALGKCATIEEFDKYLIERGKPVATINNLGVIDAKGAAAYYEFNGYDWVKYDVNDPAVAPEGYRVVTNFSWSGDAKGSGGWDRYYSAQAIMADFKKNDKGLYDMTVEELYNAFVRSFRHEVVGVKDLEALSQYKYFRDGGMICSAKTCGFICFEGVPVGTNPKYTVMWSNIGYPVTAVTVPLIVGNENLVPEFIWKEGEKKARIFAKSYDIRDTYIYDMDWKGATSYFNVAHVQKSLDAMRQSEKFIATDFYSIFDKWYKGKMKDKEFYKQYLSKQNSWWESYLDVVKAL